MHPELRRLMVAAAVATHEDGGLFERRFEFPNYDHADLPIDRDERAYLERLKRGELLPSDRLPNWTRALLDRYLLFLIPLLVLGALLFARRTILLGFYSRRKLDRWYDILRRIDLRSPGMDAAEVEECMEVLAGIEQEVLEQGVLSEAKRAEFQDLRGHIALVEERLERRRNELGAEPAGHD